MAEVVIPAPIPLTWKGHYEDLPHERFEWMAGWSFYCPPGKWVTDGNRLSPHYREHVQPHRLPIVVLCPVRDIPGVGIVGTPFCVDNLSTVKNEPWDVHVDMDSLVVGERPLITVTPSVHLVHTWHGFIRDGMLVQA